MLKAKWTIAAVPVLSLLAGSSLFADTYQVDGTAPNLWPAQIAFTAPCGVQEVSGTNDPSTWFPPVQVDQVAANNPSNLCATQMRTLTDPINVSVTTIGAVNPSYKTAADGTPLPPAIGGTQDPQNAPTSIVEVSSSGSVAFVVPVSFRDTSDTSFDGEADGVLEFPYDTAACPDPIGPNALPLFADPNTGLRPLTTVPFTCLITTPSDYETKLKSGHLLKWAQATNASLIAYGPTDTLPAGAQSWQHQSRGGTVTGSLSIPFLTQNNSTVMRIGVRYSIGYQGQIPLVWGGWPTPWTCSEQSRRDGTCLQSSNGWGGMQTAWIYSQPFTTQVQPVSLVQFHFLPITLIYNPPGNQSTASIQTTQTTTQSYQVDQNLTMTDQGDYDRKTKSDTSMSPSVGISKYSVSGNFDNSETWDSGVKSSTGAAYAQSVSSVVSFGQIAAYNSPKTDTTTPDVKDLTFQTEPFWLDQIVVAMHPQFAVWDYPDPRGQNPKGQTLLQALGSNAIVTFTVQQLQSCLPKPLTPADQSGLTINLDSLGANNVTTMTADHLLWTECAQLLALDPFYVGLSQSAAPPTGISVLPSVRSLTTAGKLDELTYITSNSAKTTATNTTKATITSAMQNSITKGLSVQYGTYPVPIVSNKVNTSGNTTTSVTSTDEVDVSLGTTQSTQVQQSFDAKMTLGDCPLVSGKSSCQAPVTPCPPQQPPSISCGYPNVEVFQDSRFGTLMGALPDLKIAPPVNPSRVQLAAIPAYLSQSGISATHLSLAASSPSTGSSGSSTITKPIIVRKAALGTPRLPGPVGTRIVQAAQPMAIPHGMAMPLPPKWQGKIFNTAPQPTVAIVRVAPKATTAASKTAVVTTTPATRTATPAAPQVAVTPATTIAPAVRTVPGAAVRTVTPAPTTIANAPAAPTQPAAQPAATVQPTTRTLAAPATPAVAAGAPDLSVALADVHLAPTAPQAGQATTFSAVIRNLGAGAAQNATVVFRLYANGKQVAISQPVIFSVAARGTYQANWSATAPAGTASQVVVSVTSPGDLNATNNQATLQFGALALSPQRPQ
jgi:hypothetical protein